MKFLSLLLVFVLLLSSCSTPITNEASTAENKPITPQEMVKEIDEVSMPTKLEHKAPDFIKSNNEIVTFTSTLNSKEYLESVSSPDNEYTLYNKEDLPEFYTFIDKEISESQKNEENISYNYIVKDQNLESLTIESDVPYMISFENTTINAKATPALILKGSGKCFINLVGDLTLSDSVDNNKKGVITAEGDVIITGEGSLTLTANKKHGLKVDGSLRILSGVITITTTMTAEGNAISVDTYFIQDGGDVAIFATNDTHNNENKGIKVNGTEERESGKLVINGGRLYIESVDKGLTAGWKISEDATTESTADDPDPSLYINNGIISIITTGEIYEISDEESLSPEGIEAKNNLVINGGLVQVSTSDDALNAGRSIEINGGYVFCQSRDADAIDSNGVIKITGGTTIALGSNAPEMGIDCDLSENFTYQGGTIIAISGSNNNAPDSKDTSGYVIRENLEGSSFALLDENGKVIIAYTLPDGHESKNSLMLASDDIKLGSTYYYISDAAISGKNIFNGIISKAKALGEKTEITIEQHVNGASQEMDFGRKVLPEGFDPSKMTPPEDFDPSKMPPREGFERKFKDFK